MRRGTSQQMSRGYGSEDEQANERENENEGQKMRGEGCTKGRMNKVRPLRMDERVLTLLRDSACPIRLVNTREHRQGPGAGGGARTRTRTNEHEAMGDDVR